MFDTGEGSFPSQMLGVAMLNPPKKVYIYIYIYVYIYMYIYIYIYMNPRPFRFRI